MEKLSLAWHICDTEDDNTSIERYCHNCGKKTLFRDSLKRRHNANGNNIFAFAIYKCPKDHTWNKKIATYKSTTHQPTEEMIAVYEYSKLTDILLFDLKMAGIKEIEIFLEEVKTAVRLDKLLSAQTKDQSRTQIEKSIKSGKILLDQRIVKPGTLLKSNQKISWII